MELQLFTLKLMILHETIDDATNTGTNDWTRFVLNLCAHCKLDGAKSTSYTHNFTVININLIMPLHQIRQNLLRLCDLFAI